MAKIRERDAERRREETSPSPSPSESPSPGQPLDPDGKAAKRGLLIPLVLLAIIVAAVLANTLMR